MDDPRAIAEAFDPKAPPAGFVENPYPVYDALRTYAPVKRLPDGGYFLTRYADLMTVYRDTRLYSSDKTLEFGAKYGDAPLRQHHTASLVFNDPPLHTRVRKIIVGALTPRAIAAMAPGLIALVDGLLDTMEARGEADLIEDFAAAIPIEVIGNLFDMPHEDRAPLRDWSLAILGALEPTLTPEQEARGNAAVVSFTAYLRDLVAARRRRPGDAERDVLTRLIAGEDGDALSERELLQNCVFILNAGHETTTNLIGNTLATLDAWPEQRARLIADPSLIESAVEESLRFESSNQLGNRITTAEVELGGVVMAPETPVTLCIGAANRDPAQFPDPARFDIARKPNKHLSFGAGAHLCAGFSLARLEGRTAIGRFLARFPHYRIAEGARLGGRIRFRGYAQLPAILG